MLTGCIRFCQQNLAAFISFCIKKYILNSNISGYITLCIMALVAFDSPHQQLRYAVHSSHFMKIEVISFCFQTHHIVKSTIHKTHEVEHATCYRQYVGHHCIAT